MKISKKELEKLVMEGLMNEIGPEMAASALSGNIGKMHDPRAKQILKDSITSMFSKYIGKKMPFAIKTRENSPAAEYVLVEVVLRGNNKELVDFHFYNEDGVQNDAPYADNKKEIVITYKIEEDLYDVPCLVNTFTSRFLVKAANMLREMYYKAYPWKSEIEVDGENVQDPNFNIKSKIKKGYFRMFSYDSQAMLNEGKDTGNPFDLNNSSNLANVHDKLDKNLKELQDYREKYYDKIIDVWTYYCGQRSNDAGVSNDNRAILYSLLESGEFDNNMVDDNMASQVLGKIKEKINQMWSPNGLHQDKNGTDFYTNNPEDMEAHLQKMGYSKGDYTLSPGDASRNDDTRFEQPYSNPDTREGSMSLNESEIRKIVRRALK